MKRNDVSNKFPRITNVVASLKMYAAINFRKTPNETKFIFKLNKKKISQQLLDLIIYSEVISLSIIITGEFGREIRV